MTDLWAVIFDRDGVLTSFDTDHARSFFAARLPLPLNLLQVRWNAHGQAHGFPTSNFEEAEFMRSFWLHLSESLQLSATITAELVEWNYTSILRPFPEAQPALLELRERHVKIGVLSNFSLASLEGSLKAVGLLDYIDVACAATVIGVAKPAVEAYQIVAAKLGVAPHQCLMLDDEAPCVAGARAAGMHAYLVDRSRATHSLPEKIICDLSIVPELLASLRA